MTHFGPVPGFRQLSCSGGFYSVTAIRLLHLQLLILLRGSLGCWACDQLPEASCGGQSRRLLDGLPDLVRVIFESRLDDSLPLINFLELLLSLLWTGRLFVLFHLGESVILIYFYFNYPRKII